MADDTPTRAGNYVRRLDQVERTFGAAGIYPDDAESRKKFGDQYRRMEYYLDRKERRGRWLAGLGTAIAIAVFTALIVSRGPLLIHLLDQMSK